MQPFRAIATRYEKTAQTRPPAARNKRSPASVSVAIVNSSEAPILFSSSHRAPLHARVRQANQAGVELIGQIAARKRATAAQIALAWLLTRKPWIVPIPGTTKLHRLEENLGAADIGLTADDLRDIDAAVSKIDVEGVRYPPFLAAMVDR